MKVVVLAILIPALAFYFVIAFLGIRATLRIGRNSRPPETPHLRRIRRLMLASMPASMVLGAGLGAIIDGRDRGGGVIAGGIVGMFAWLFACWVAAFELARRQWMRRKQPMR